MSDIPVMKRIGWVGIVNSKPYFEKTTDDYVGILSSSIQSVVVYKSKKEAKRRFEVVRPVFIDEEQQ